VAFGEDYRPIPVSRLDLHVFERTPHNAAIVEPVKTSSNASVEGALG